MDAIMASIAPSNMELDQKFGYYWIAWGRQVFADESSFMATTRLPQKGPSAKGQGPKMRD
jgi:hypothetical protein